MELIKQVVSLELAKKLKELGVKQDAYFSWKKLYRNGELVEELVLTSSIPSDYPSDGYFSAFTVAELGEALPDIIRVAHTGKIRDYATLEMQKYQQTTDGGNSFGVMYVVDSETIASYNGEQIEEYGNTEADARAKMRIYLIENKLIKLNND